MSPNQIRAARAFLGWTQADLAREAGLSEAGVKSLERGGHDPRMSTLGKVTTAFERAGLQMSGGGLIPNDAREMR